MSTSEKLTDRQQQRLYYFLLRLRDKIAVDINQGTTRDPTEFKAVCDLINEVQPALFPPRDGPPPGVKERRGNVH